MDMGSAKKLLFGGNQDRFDSPVNLKKAEDKFTSQYQDSTAYQTKRKQITDAKRETSSKFLFSDSSEEDLSLRKDKIEKIQA